MPCLDFGVNSSAFVYPIPALTTRVASTIRPVRRLAHNFLDDCGPSGVLLVQVCKAWPLSERECVDQHGMRRYCPLFPAFAFFVFLGRRRPAQTLRPASRAKIFQLLQKRASTLPWPQRAASCMQSPHNNCQSASVVIHCPRTSLWHGPVVCQLQRHFYFDTFACFIARTCGAGVHLCDTAALARSNGTPFLVASW